MRAAILLVLLTACYTENDAVKQLREMNRPEPVVCASLSQAGADITSFACSDGAGVSWVCKKAGCFKWSR